MDAIKENWTTVKEAVRREYSLSDISYHTWVEPLEFHNVVNDVVSIIIPSDQAHALNYISSKYKSFFQVTITEMFDHPYDINFILEKDVKAEEPAENEMAVPNQIYGINYEDAHLNPKYKFDTFVVLYVTSEEFTNEVIESIRSGNAASMTKLREKYRNVDVLMVDDVQFIIGKESTQEEFFHTFNALHAAHKQIILSSDKPPKEMETLDERFRSRFEWGLLADIQSPDYETRIAILRKKQELDGYSVSDDVIEYIASNIKSNIRELEGALNKIIAYANLEKREINIDLAEQVLRDIISPNEKKVITPEFIIDTVADHFDITPSDIVGSKRSSKIVFPRQIAMYLCREMLDAPLTGIGKMMGDRDHTTVMHGIEKIEKEMSAKDSVRNTVDILKKKINPSK
jgi:chromosomal replication initiator protein